MTTLMEEIAQQPAVLSGLRKYYASPGAIPTKALRSLLAGRQPTVVFTGMGSSLFAAYPAQAYLTGLGIRALVWEAAELLHHHVKFLGADTLLVAVSQSGETVEIIRLLDSLPPEVNVVAVANVEASTLARRGKLLLPMMAGRQSMVSTKTYTCSVAVLMYLALAIAGKPPRALTQALMQAVEAQERVLERHEVLTPPTLAFFNNPPYVALMSRGADMASAYQGALMLKEVARVPAEPITAAQFRHGPIEIINPSHRYVVFARQGLPGRQDKTGKLLLKLADELRSHGGRVLLYTDLPFEDVANVKRVQVPAMRLGLGTVVDSVYIQLLAHELALRAGLEPGKFRIASDVTREE
jgi:glucosamine--fructose-6-phosphate aminotransferase (isomerizing)